jgi:hypothetical protein
VDHGNPPDRVSEAVLETLIEMSAESQINIWHRETGLSKQSLAALYRMYETGAGYRRSRLHGNYETGRKEREETGRKERERGNEQPETLIGQNAFWAKEPFQRTMRQARPAPPRSRTAAKTTGYCLHRKIRFLDNYNPRD